MNLCAKLAVDLVQALNNSIPAPLSGHLRFCVFSVTKTLAKLEKLLDKLLKAAKDNSVPFVLNEFNNSVME